MSFHQTEGSVESARPYYLYEFIVGNQTYRFCNSIDNLVYNGNTYSAVAVDHSSIKFSEELAKDNIRITLPFGLTFTELFKGLPIDINITVNILKGHYGTNFVTIWWKGRVTAHEPNDHSISLNCETIFTSVSRAGFIQKTQKNCRHTLYRRGCNVNQAAFMVRLSVSAIDRLDLTVQGAALLQAQWFLGGIIVFDNNDQRLITDHDGAKITLNRTCEYLRSNTPPYDVTMYPGCNKTLDTCHNKFSNRLNHGGFPFIPQRNPFGGTSL